MNKVNISKFRKIFAKTALGKFSLLHMRLCSLLWQYVATGYYSTVLQYAAMTASIIFILFVFWKILKPAGYMEGNGYW